MYAPHSLSSTPQSVRKQRPRRRSRIRAAYAPAPQVWELSAKLLVNGLLLAVTGTSLAKLVPYLQDRFQALELAQAELAIAEQQTAHLRSDFERYFDPSQTKEIMQEQTGWELPSERKIVWIDPTQAAASDPAGDPQAD